MKSQAGKHDEALQTDLSLGAYCGCMGGIGTNYVETEAIRNLGSPLMSFLNVFLLKYPEKDTLPWDDVYQDAEKVLQGRNFPGSDSAEDEEHAAMLNVHEACLHTFLHKSNEPPESAAASLYSFLNVLFARCNVI